MVEITHTQEENKMSIYKHGLKYSDNGENQAVLVKGGYVHPIKEPVSRKKALSSRSLRLKKRDIFFTHGMKHAGKDNYKPNNQFPNGY